MVVFQALSSHMWLAAPILNASVDIEHFHHPRTFYRKTLV